MDRVMAFIMVKAPVPGQVKSRLASAIGDEAAALLYRSMASRTVRSLIDADIPLTVAYHPPGSEKMIKEVFGVDVPLIPQRGSDLGERLKNGFMDLFIEYDHIIALSSDVPELDPKTVIDAFQKLESADAVLGSCPDGGFYLLGFNASTFREEAFEGIPWSTDGVAVAVLWKLKGLSVSLMPELNDIDTIEDLLDMMKRFGVE